MLRDQASASAGWPQWLLRLCMVLVLLSILIYAMAADASSRGFSSQSRVLLYASIVAALLIPVAYHQAFRTMRQRNAELAQREVHLRASEERFHQLTRAASDAMISVDGSGMITFWNDAAVRMFGYSAAEMLGKPLSMVLPQVEGNSSDDIVPTAVEGDALGFGGSVAEVRARRQDGQEFVAERSLANWQLEGQTCSTLILRDITERKHQMAHLEHDEACFRSLAAILHYPSQNTQELLDFTLKETIALTESEFGYIYLYSEDRRQFTLNTWSRGVMEQCAVADPQRVYDLDKTGVWGEAVRQRRPIVLNEFEKPHPLKRSYPQGHVPLRRFMTVPVISEGKIVAVAGVANREFPYSDADVQQMQMLMDAVWKVVVQRQSHATAAASESRFRALYDQMAEMVAVHEIVRDDSGTARDYRIIECNPAYETTIGISRGMAAGALASQLYGTGSAPYLEDYARVVETGVADTLEVFFEPMQKYFRVSVVSLGKDQFATITLDVTETKAAKAALLLAGQ